MLRLKTKLFANRWPPVMLKQFRSSFCDLRINCMHQTTKKDWDKNLHMGLLFTEKGSCSSIRTPVHILKHPNCTYSATSICTLSIKCIMLHV